MTSLRRTLVFAAVTLAAQPLAAQSTPAAKSAAKPAAAMATPVKPAAAPATYQIDATHSELTFRIRHLLGRVRGTFGEWGGTIVMDEATPAKSRVEVSIKTGSIDTQNDKRDEHLRSPDFFAADSFPAITFKSTNVAVTGKQLRISGVLTMRGKSKPVVLTGEFGGQFKDPWGNMRTAFTASTTVNRQDYGVSYNSVVETGTMLGDDVTIEIAVEAIKQDAKQGAAGQ